MSSTISSAVADRLVLPLLSDLLPRPTVDELESSVRDSFWRAVVERNLLTDDQLLIGLSARTRFPLAADLVVSDSALNAVPERLARRFAVLPLAISESILDVATSNPYDLDCEQLLAFATRRRVRMSLAAPHRILERIEEVYAPVDRVSSLLERAPSAIEPVIEKVEDTDPDFAEGVAERPVIKLVDH